MQAVAFWALGRQQFLLLPRRPDHALPRPLPRVRTDPDVSWDTGRCVWATPFEHSKAGEGPAEGLKTGCYSLVMALPLEGATG